MLTAVVLGADYPDIVDYLSPQVGSSTHVRRVLRRLEQAYLKPIFGGRGAAPLEDVRLPEVHEALIQALCTSLVLARRPRRSSPPCSDCATRAASLHHCADAAPTVRAAGRVGFLPLLHPLGQMEGRGL